jgi:ectoine hydroxylase-related dioxygenase (phytanoyl-CoA dioxygenase family)
MSLSKEQLDQYRTDGFVIVPDFFSAAEATLMQRELSNLREQGIGRNVATDGDGETLSTTQTNLQIIPLSPQSEVFRAIPYAAKVRETISQLIGDPFVLQLDQIFVKPAGQGAGTGWHQDNHYFRIPDPTHGVGMWVAVHAASVENGTMHVVPRTYQTLREHTRDLGSDHHLSCSVDETVDTVVPVEMPAGGALFFNYGVPHCTKANLTDHDRAGMALHFLKKELIDVASSGGRVRPILSGPNYKGGADVYGTSLEGAWESMVS